MEEGIDYKISEATLEYVRPEACESLEMCLEDYMKIAKANAFRKVPGLKRIVIPEGVVAGRAQYVL